MSYKADAAKFAVISCEKRTGINLAPDKSGDPRGR